MIQFFESSAMVESVKMAQETKHSYKNIEFGVKLENDKYSKSVLTPLSESKSSGKATVVSRK